MNSASRAAEGKFERLSSRLFKDNKQVCILTGQGSCSVSYPLPCAGTSAGGSFSGADRRGTTTMTGGGNERRPRQQGDIPQDGGDAPVTGVFVGVLVTGLFEGASVTGLVVGAWVTGPFDGASVIGLVVGTSVTGFFVGACVTGLIVGAFGHGTRC